MVDLTAAPTSIQTLYGWFREGKLIVNRRYQRKLVWTLDEKQKLIDSILQKYPIPAIFLAEINGKAGHYEVIDGMQRLHTLMSFIETTFSTLDGKYFDLTYFPTALQYRDSGAFTETATTEKIDQKAASVFLDYTLAVSMMRNASEAQVNDVFDRINTYGHRLSDQERRQSGVQDDFSNLVRDIACSVRGDVSTNVLPLYAMPAVSIDLPKSRHGYEVKADEVFWVRHGILRSTDLRDSLDEQCIADIAASIVGGQLIDRSRQALDDVYTSGSSESNRILSALKVYGLQNFREEFSFVIQEIERIADSNCGKKLNELLFEKKNNNSYPAVFTAFFISLHELMISEGMKIADMPALIKALKGVAEKMNAGQKGANSDQRRINVDTAKGIARPYFVKDEDIKSRIYSDHKTVDIDGIIQRSQVELARFELKQGLLDLNPGAKDPKPMLEKLMATICAIANIGKTSSGTILLGVTDKAADALRVKQIDGIDGRPVGSRHVVGIVREANRLGITVEKYLHIIRDYITNANVTPELKSKVLGAMDFNDYFGLGVVVINVPPQKEMSILDDMVFDRRLDQTVAVTGPKEIGAVAQRF